MQVVLEIKLFDQLNCNRVKTLLQLLFCWKLFIGDYIFIGDGAKVVVEEFLEGVEASMLLITDGKTILPFVSGKDHIVSYN